MERPIEKRTCLFLKFILFLLKHLINYFSKYLHDNLLSSKFTKYASISLYSTIYLVDQYIPFLQCGFSITTE